MKSPIRVLASCSSRLELKLLSDLHNENHIKLLGVTSWEKMPAELAAFLPHEAREISGSDLASQSIQNKFTAYKMVHLDIETLSAFSTYVADFYKMMDRADTTKSQTYLQREQSFLFLVSFWLDFIANQQPEIVYFSGTPHEIVDFVLFACCEVKNIRTAMWQDAHTIQAKILTEHWRGPWKSILNPDSSHINSDLDKAKELLRKFQGGYATAEPVYNIQARDRALRDKRPSLENIFCLSTEGFRVLSRVVREFLKDSRRLRLEFALSRVQSLFIASVQSIRKLGDMAITLMDTYLVRKYFRAKVSSVLPEEKYVVYFLHYQPEMTVTPMGDVSGNQYLALASISKLLPPGWKLLVREHPAQFVKTYAGYYTGRDRYFYQRILSLPSTYLISNSIDTFEIIDKAEAVATVSGTVGWEAVARHKPSIIFGNSWYMDAPGVSRVSELKDLEKVLNAISTGSIEIEDRDLINFLAFKIETFDHIKFDPEVSRIEGTKWKPEIFEMLLRLRLEELFKVNKFE